MNMKSLYWLALFGVFPLQAASAVEDGFKLCMMAEIADASADVTVGELRKRCREKSRGIEQNKSTGFAGDAAASKRLRTEVATEDSDFVITPYLPNYILFAAYNTADLHEAVFEQAFPDKDVSLNRTEAKFQISFKFPVVKDLFGENTGHLYAAYTNRSFWQVYNKNSAPFRETNHQPELWLRFYNDWQFLGLRNIINDIGIVHQSNGRGGDLSRSWNRIYARFIFEKDNLAFSVQPWYRIKEDADNDDNPDIEDYLGNVEFLGAYKWGEQQFGLMLRNNFDSDRNRGAAQIDWSFPLYGRLRGYVQWFNGYGENLIDYNQNVNSIGVGIKLTDWL